METTWFAIVWGMLAIYAILDGFDLGVGALHLFVARSESQRRSVLSSIGPIWDGNEVWLIAAGGVLFMSFPRTYAVAFSGFYLALMIVLWLLILRGVAIEFRIQQKNLLWIQFWDAVFAVASTLLILLFGITLGNLIRGVPLSQNGLSGMPLFTNFKTTGQVGVMDWYTLLIGIFAVVALAGHGGLFLIWRTAGEVQARSRTYALRCWKCTAFLWIATTAATAWVRPEMFSNLWNRPWSLLLVCLALVGMAGVFYFIQARKEKRAFCASCLYLLSLLGAITVGVFPIWLRSTIDPAFSLTAFNTASTTASLRIALLWLPIGMLLITGYFVMQFYYIRGKVDETPLDRGD